MLRDERKVHRRPPISWNCPLRILRRYKPPFLKCEAWVCWADIRCRVISLNTTFSGKRRDDLAWIKRTATRSQVPVTPTQHAYQEDKGFPDGSVYKESACNARDRGDASLVPGSGRSPGGGNGNPLQYSCLKNPMDGEAWWTTVHGVTMSRTWLSTAHALHEERGDTGCGSILKAGCLTGLCEHLALPHVRSLAQGITFLVEHFQNSPIYFFLQITVFKIICLWESSGKLNDISWCSLKKIRPPLSLFHVMFLKIGRIKISMCESI